MVETLPPPALEAIGEWLRAHANALPPVKADRCSGGYSNITFRLSDLAGRAWILRRPPLGYDGGPAHDVIREARVVRALARSSVPVPTVVMTSEEGPDAGFSYTIMSFVAGYILFDRATAERSMTADARPALAAEMMRVLADIHAVPSEASGLEDRTRTNTYFERQLERWAPNANNAAEVALHKRLRAGVEDLPDRRALLHGDFHLGNVIATELGNVCAVIDWEMAALGDPFVDLGCALAYWQQPDDDPELVPLPSGLLGFPSRRSMAELYATFADRDVTALDLYVAFGHWKLGRIAADIRARLRRGTMGALEVEAALLDRQVAARLRAASEALAGHW